MLLFPNTLCCSLYERNCVCAVTKIFTKFLPANNFCQLLRVTRKRSCTFAGNAQAQLHFRDGISNISSCNMLTLSLGDMHGTYLCTNAQRCTSQMKLLGLKKMIVYPFLTDPKYWKITVSFCFLAFDSQFRIFKQKCLKVKC